MPGSVRLRSGWMARSRCSPPNLRGICQQAAACVSSLPVAVGGAFLDNASSASTGKEFASPECVKRNNRITEQGHRHRYRHAFCCLKR